MELGRKGQLNIEEEATGGSLEISSAGKSQFLDSPRRAFQSLNHSLARQLFLQASQSSVVLWATIMMKKYQRQAPSSPPSIDDPKQSLSNLRLAKATSYNLKFQILLYQTIHASPLSSDLLASVISAPLTNLTMSYSLSIYLHQQLHQVIRTSRV